MMQYADRIKQIAEIAHEANRRYCATMMGDHSHLDWKESPDELKESIVIGVMKHKLSPETTPEQSHEEWLKTKSANGWVYGEKKDFELKTHPCYRPYHELPYDQRVKDKLFKAVVSVLIAEYF